MTLRLAQPPEAIAEAAGLRPSLRPARVAALLDVDRSEVYKLVRGRQLEAHGMGTRALRIYADSVEDYRARRAKGAAPAGPKPVRLDIRHHEAVAHLRSLGVL